METVINEQEKPPAAAALLVRAGTHRFGPTGQLFVARDGRWIRIENPTQRERERADNGTL